LKEVLAGLDRKVDKMGGGREREREREREGERGREGERERGREYPSDAHRAEEHHTGKLIRKGARRSGIAGCADLDGRGLCGDDLRGGTHLNGV
jgi:hypothetical protein